MCGTPVAEANLGVRDYKTWVTDKLPGRVAPMDIDFVLERNGKFLIIELKPEHGRVGVGQGRTLRALREFADVWIMYGEGPMVDVDWGDGKTRISLDELSDEIVLWFKEASAK